MATITKLKIVAPVSGQLDLATADPTWMGVVITPANGNLVAPVTGRVVAANQATASLTVQVAWGWTVTLRLCGLVQPLTSTDYELLVRVGQDVKVGQVLAALDLVALQHINPQIQLQVRVQATGTALTLNATPAYVRVDTLALTVQSV